MELLYHHLVYSGSWSPGSALAANGRRSRSTRLTHCRLVPSNSDSIPCRVLLFSSFFLFFFISLLFFFFLILEYLFTACLTLPASVHLQFVIACTAMPWSPPSSWATVPLGADEGPQPWQRIVGWLTIQECITTQQRQDNRKKKKK